MNSLVQRHLTKGLLPDGEKTVYDLFEYKTVNAQIIDHRTGKYVVDMQDLEFPVHYSQNACNIIASKYFRKAGVNTPQGHENSMKQVVDRMTGFWTDALYEEKILKDEEEKAIFYDEIAYALLKQMWAPNSPQWFNTGIMRSYNIHGEADELYFYNEDTKEVEKSKDRYTRTQSSACFILSIADKLIGKHSISEQYVTETKLFKGGSGVGTNYSEIRAINEALSNGGASSGLMSFLKGFDKNAGAIKSGGTTRRAAKMLILDIDHPEIEDFITWKSREEDKVRALGKMGYDISMDGEAYQTVSGQNGNNSVRVNREFMQKVIDLEKNPDSEILLTGRVDSTVNKKVKVKDLWDKINQSAWECADPGLQFDDRFNAWHTCPYGLDGEYNAKHNRINATNPCSEYAFLDDTACNLASVNVYAFYDAEKMTFDTESYRHLCSLIQLVLEASIYWAHFPTDDIARNSYMFRTTGLGICNLASLLLAAGIPYDSNEGRNIAAGLCSLMTAVSYRTSAQMAREVGAFSAFKRNKKSMMKVIKNHAIVAGAYEREAEDIDYDVFKIDQSIEKGKNLTSVFDALNEEWEGAIALGEKFGYRNAQVSVIAPTGTISFAMDCAATSIEPFYSHVFYKQLSGGGYMEIVNPIVETALLNLGYSNEETKDILEYMLEKDEKNRLVNTTMEKAPHLKEEHIAIFDTANDISPQGHVLMVSAITPNISGSVSKTVNLPREASVEEISYIHLLSYKTGCKAISLYRDGCKVSQPLSTGTMSGKKKIEDYTYYELMDYAKNCAKNIPNRVRPSGMRLSRTHAAEIGDIELYVTIGYYNDGTMAELFVSSDKEGTIVKGLLAVLSKSISNMLQYKIPASEISRLLRGQQFEPAGFVSRHPYIKNASSVADLISKIIDIELGDYSRIQIKPENLQSVIAEHDQHKPEYSIAPAEKEERLYGERCAVCGSVKMFRNGNCKVCKDCGTTTGCS
ncbi:MAG: vitamin B12-dependent ribonucleotide reductase [Eubacteriaceae bacterium]|jgi:ribonucleoside-diphosphate reductase alpha chain|nr:vitamin B12-dependent ribonucleotide reductase [Eubacteriaceae bacterium]